MKKVLSLLLVLSLVFAGCAQKAETPKVSGTFEGHAQGMQGPVTVSMTVEEGIIKSVELTECTETPSIASVAMERIPAQIVEHQTYEVDTVTGATLCSNAIMNAVKDAAKTAGMDLDALKANAYHATATADETMDCDVVVVGAGGAGYSAAISAAQSGAKVIMIEKSSVAGGNTLMQGGAFNAVDAGATANRITSVAELKTLEGYLKLTKEDEALHLDQFPEWATVLDQLQSDITAFLAENKGTEAGKDMPGFDSVSLHMWHIYTGGLRQMLDGKWVASDFELAKTLAESALPTYEWLVDDVGVTGAYGSEGELHTVLGAMWPRTHSFMMSTPLIGVLTAAAEKEGVEIYTEVAGKTLITNEGKVCGVEAEKADGTKITINATKGVVIASGGYGANAKMAKEYDNYWGDDLSATTLTTNVGTNTGDGIVMAQAVGAATTGLDVVQLMPSSSPIKGTMTDGLWASAETQIWVDGNAKRFVNEYAERDVLAKTSLALEDGIFYIIYAGMVDPETGMCEGVEGNASFRGGITPIEMNEAGHIWYGSTLAELAEKTQTSVGGAKAVFTEEALREAIENYNKIVDDQFDPDFGKEVIGGKIDLEAIEANDAMGITITPRRASIHHTMGGISINTAAEVLDTDGNVIPGLWAAGEVTGGIHAGNRLGGNAVADIFTFGRIAGTNAAK